MQKSGFIGIEVVRDAGGHERMLFARPGHF
jgi:hypothetical protein